MADFDPYAILDPNRMERQIVSGGGGAKGATGATGATGPTGPSGGGGTGAAGPFPFFGARGTSVSWSRPSLATFSIFLNEHPVGLTAATASDGAGQLPIVLTSLQDDVMGGGCLTALLKSIGAPPWTIVAGVAGGGNASNVGGPVGSALPIYFSPIVLYDSGADKAVTMNWWGGGVSTAAKSGAVQVFQYTSTVLDANSGGFVSPGGLGFPFPEYFGYFKVSNIGGTLIC